MSDQNNNWERGVLEKLAMSAMQEQRRARHWGIFFKTMTLGFMFIAAVHFHGLDRQERSRAESPASTPRWWICRA